MEKNMPSTNRLSVKLFIGYPLNSEVKLHLKNSNAWNQSKIGNDPSNSSRLIEVHYQNKDYVGYLLDEDQQGITLPSLREMEKTIQQLLSDYCPKLEFKNFKVVIFPQIFIS